MTPASRTVLFAASLLLVVLAAAQEEKDQSRANNGEQRGLLPTLGLLAFLKLSRPLLYSGGFHSYGTFGSAGAYFHPHAHPHPLYFGGAGGFGGIGGVGGFGAGTGVAGIPGYPLGGFPGHPLGVVGPFNTNNVRGGAAPTSIIPTSSTSFNDLRLDENKIQDPVATGKPSYMQYFQEAASPFIHRGQRVQSRHLS